MIGVYAGVSVKPEHVEEFLASAPTLVEASRKDAGNISYDFGPAAGETPAGEPRAFAFIERWESQQALEAHMATEHFGTAVKPGSRCSPQSWMCASSKCSASSPLLKRALM